METEVPKVVRRWCDLVQGDPIYCLRFSNDVLVDLSVLKFEYTTDHGWFTQFEFYDEKIANDPDFGEFYTSSFTVHNDNLEICTAYDDHHLYFSNKDAVTERVILYEKEYLTRIVGYFRDVLRQL